MTASDRYVVSGQNYTTWSNNMVAQGMMHWPDTPSSKQIKARTTSWSVNSVACGFIGGTSSSYEIGEAKFCAFVRDFFVRDYVGLTLTGVSFPPQDGLCDDNQDCTMIIDLAFGIGGSLVKDAIPAFCEDIFEAVWNDCSGSGGSAELTVGSETGTVQAQFFVRDEGATSPATLGIVFNRTCRAAKTCRTSMILSVR